MTIVPAIFLRVVIKGHPGRMREYVEGLCVKGENMENTKRIYGVDLLKFFMDFAVISIHTSLASMINGEIAYSCLIIIQKAAVPFFFICNGYFAGVSKRNNYKAYAFRFAKMYVIWSIIYLPLDLIGGGYSLLSYCRDFFLKGYHNYSWHLWYLLGLVYGFTLLLLCKKLKISNRAVHLIVGIMYTLGRILTYCALSYSGNNMYIMQIGAIVHSHLYSGRLLCVPLYLVFGYDLTRNDFVGNKLSDFTLYVCAVVCLALDVFWLNNEVSYVIIPFLVFLMSKRLNLPHCEIWKKLGRLSYWMYFFHMYVVFASAELFKLNSQIKQIFVPLVSIAIAAIFVIAERKQSSFGLVYKQ